jgi:hypothetical protein
LTRIEQLGTTEPPDAMLTDLGDLRYVDGNSSCAPPRTAAGCSRSTCRTGRTALAKMNSDLEDDVVGFAGDDDRADWN